tara:strand:- start:3286 stop:4239 length:954 start_codon:yes stop_codon:yes gene_type:complete
MATITITPGNSFTPNQTVTSTRLNDLGSPTAALTAASIGTADIADDAITPALIADDAITTASIADDAITTALIADDAVTTALIADDAITTALIADDAVTSALIADDAITPALIAGDAITTPAILDANVTFAKLTDVIDSDTMTGASATTLATSESIKAYIDKFKPNIVQAVKTGVTSILNPNNIWYDVTDLSIDITPKFSNSKILISADVSSTVSNGAYGVLFRFVRDDNAIAVGDASGSRTQCSWTGGYTGGRTSPSNGMSYLDSSSVTAGTSVEYKIQCTCETTVDIYINRSLTNSDANEVPRPISTLTATEIYQ